MKSLFALLLLTSSFAHAGTWNLKCSGLGYRGRTDNFQATMDTDKKLIFIRTSSDSYPFIKTSGNESTDLGAIDPRFFEADFSENFSVVSADVTTYNYFSGNIEFYLGKGLSELTKGVDFSIVGDNSVTADIAVVYDDGDGYGFRKRKYTCKVTAY